MLRRKINVDLNKRGLFFYLFKVLAPGSLKTGGPATTVG
jgi:hypothetical protein